MGSIVAILLFSMSLIVCLLLKLSVVYALIIGYIIFISYGLIKGHNLIVLIKKSFEGVLTVKNILLVFILIGMITALWRASGTIAFIVYIGSKLISPSILIFLTFLFCAVLSVLIGTSLGTAATMGVICASIGKAMGINPYYVGGAVLSGIYFGDRCSPMSTSALLIAELTKTNLYTNIKLMIKTSIIPFIVTCLFYLFLGFKSKVSNISVDVTEIFKQNYNLNIIVIIPAILIIILSILKINVKKTMLVSIVISFIIAMFIQRDSIVALIKYCIFGYHHTNEKLNLMMKGGGILSMDVPLKAIDVGFMSGLFAFYLYFLPLWNLFLDFIKERKYEIKI